jgi:hypothetical protein
MLMSSALAPEYAAEATVLPSAPYVETRGDSKILNFDLMLHNTGRMPVRLVTIREQVFDRHGALESARELNGNGSPPALAAGGDLVLQPGGTSAFFHPFDRYAANVDLDRIHLEFVFLPADKPVPPVVLHGDVAVELDLRPRAVRTTTYCLPLAGRLLVHDGHDIASHHRRRNLAQIFTKDPAAAVNANRYAYDFVRIDDRGALFTGDPNQKESWLTIGAPVFAPTDGVVTEAVDGIPDNHFVAGEAVIPDEAQRLDPGGFGNHVTIRAADGRASWLLHLEAGSIAVRPGEAVRTGDMLGRIGFSGDALFPHLHYTVTERTTYPSEGVPSYFRGFQRVLGTRSLPAGDGQIDTGDIIRRSGCERR